MHFNRQESYFQWCFGVAEPDCFGAVDVNTGKAVLFIPKLPIEYQVWMGEIYPPSHFKSKYDLDDVQFVDDVSFFPKIIQIRKGLIMQMCYLILKSKILKLVKRKATTYHINIRSNSFYAR